MATSTSNAKEQGQPITSTQEQERAAYLLDAQSKAVALFEEIERDIIRPGVSEKVLNNEIHELGAKRHDIRTHWHKRVIRSGPNTLLPYAENPADRVIEEDDILFVDLGPVFEAWVSTTSRFRSCARTMTFLSWKLLCCTCRVT